MRSFYRLLTFPAIRFVLNLLSLGHDSYCGAGDARRLFDYIIVTV